MIEEGLQAQHDQAVDLAIGGKLEEARAAFERLVGAQPDWEDPWRNMGLALLRLGRPLEALEAYRNAFKLRPSPANGNRVTIILRDLDRLDEAAELSRAMVAAHPTVPECWLQLGCTQLKQEDFQGAVTSLSEGVRLAPNLPGGQANLGIAYQKADDLESAIVCFQQAPRLEPDSPEALCNLASALSEAHRTAEAIPYFSRALELKPDNATIHNNYGNALRIEGRTQEAMKSLNRALAINPEYPEAIANLALAYVQLKDYTMVLKLCDNAIKLDPKHAGAHLYRGMTWLAQGDFKRGWPEYEWRWLTDKLEKRTFDKPQWKGEKLPKGTILLHYEQGQGDTIQFVRYAQMVKKRVGTVIVECQGTLARLLSSCPGVDKVVAAGTPLPPFDVYAPLMSLPAIFKTLIETIPAPIPYLSVDEKEIARRARDLGPKKAFRVGIAWQGNPKHESDRMRSIPLRSFEALARVPGVELVSLQKSIGVEQIPHADRVPLVDLDSRIADFLDSAAFMKNLDLVVSADTACAHLAGALGVPVWLASSFESEWRWLIDRTDTPWYPSMRIFHQQGIDDWRPLMQTIAEALAKQLNVEAPAPVVSPAQPVTPPPPRNPAIISNGSTRLKAFRYGHLLYLATDQYVGRSIDRYGEYSEGEIQIFNQLIKPGWTVIEAGANLGAHTVPLARIVGPRGVVHAFEPQRVMFQILCANAALNALGNIHAQHVALGNHAGSVLIPSLDPAVFQNFGSLSHHQWGQGERVTQITLDSLNLEACNFIKIDVEGMEGAVIAGATQTINKFRPAMYIENDREAQSPALISQLQRLNYRLYWHKPPLYNPQNHFQEHENVFGEIVSINMLALPGETPQNIAGMREVSGPNDNWRLP